MAVIKKGPSRKLRGIRASIPRGHVLGRISEGEGDVELIHLSELGNALTSGVGGGGGGDGGGGGVASASSVQKALALAGGARSIALSIQQIIQQTGSGGAVFEEMAPNELPIPLGQTQAVAGASSLADDTDVSITSPADDDILIYNATDSKWENGGLPIYIQKDCGDETTAITAATGKKTFRMPHAMTLDDVRASLTTAQATGSIFTVDVKQSGSSIFSTLLTIDNTETTSKTAATPAALSSTTLYDDDEMRIDVTQIGDGTATGLKVTFIGARSNATTPSGGAVGWLGGWDGEWDGDWV